LLLHGQWKIGSAVLPMASRNGSPGHRRVMRDVGLVGIVDITDVCRALLEAWHARADDG
jgi:hypothetical protein